MKKVSSKVVKTAPFFERRVRHDRLNIKYRRAGDTPPVNIAESQVINSAAYRVSSGKLKASNHNSPGGQLLDCYA